MFGGGLMLYAYNCNIFPLNNKQAERLKEGDIVEVTVDRVGGRIQWAVGG